MFCNDYREMLAVITRYLFVCAALWIFIPAPFADGEYQHTKDGKTTVWNNDSRPGDEAAWSGDRDREGYATGFGTLTWYTGGKQSVRHLGIPITTSEVYARYFGNMVHGRFEGPVNAHAKGKTDHAVFIDGVRHSRWAAGPAPSRKMPQPRLELAKQEASAEPTSVKRSGVAEPAAPAEGPVQKADVTNQKEEISGQTSENTDRATAKPTTQNIPASSVGAGGAADVKRPPTISNPPPAKKSQAEVEKSLLTLVGPPSSLHARPHADVPAANAEQETKVAPLDGRLTKEGVVDLADAEARTRGYNPAEYERTEPRYDPADQIWTINYERRLVDETLESGKRFSVTIDDKTKGIVFVPGK
ncbi:MAG: hypothetical protein QOI96_294 [Verrucomicrobiota bacterium]